MTDNEIIKAFECCVNGECTNCPKRSEEEIGCHSRACRDALDLLQRQRATINGQQTIIKMASDIVKESVDHTKTAKAEAATEFAEFVLALFPCDRDFTTISRHTILRFKKIMTGESDR